jgi:hypothetical protein
MTMTTTTTDRPAEDAYSPEEETNLDAQVRRQLGLRPLYYDENGKHPDQRPCPPWCWIGQTHGEYEQHVDVRHLMSAQHELNSTPAVAATLYQGEYALADVRHARMASIEPDLEQVGQEDPIISVNLRRWEGREQHLDQVLRLTIDDTRELVKVLHYLIETAES